MLWTGTGLRRSDVQVQMSVMHDSTGQVIPAMPDQPFEYLSGVQSCLDKYKAVHKRHMYRHDTCMVTRFKVNTVPPMPSLQNLTKPGHRLAVQTHVGGLSNFYPDEIIPVNITENKVFLRLMRQHYQEQGQHKDDGDVVYSTFCTDIDICNKQLRVRVLTFDTQINNNIFL